MNTPADVVIEKLGGVDAVAAVCGVDRSTIHRWTYEKKKGGTDGRIPTQWQQTLLNHARANEIALTPADFFDPEPAQTEQAA